jgi:hypothetical protein
MIILLLFYVFLFFALQVHGLSINPTLSAHKLQSTSTGTSTTPFECPSTLETAKNQLFRIFAPDDPEGNSKPITSQMITRVYPFYR